MDARILCKSPMFLQEMARICISPLRIAFDHIGVRKPYEQAVRMAADNQILSLSNYMLYNFMDTPSDLYQRMHLNILLNEELGVRIWSFPMRYQPVNLKDRSHVGKNWNRYQLRSFQIMLQATHGIISGNPAFFNRAYGQDQQEFEHLLGLPHAFLFNRDHFEFGEGRGHREDYEALHKGLSESQQRDLINLLAGPPGTRSLGDKRFTELAKDASLDPTIREILHYHAMGTSYDTSQDNATQQLPLTPPSADTTLPPDEIVEDAGLFDHESALEKRNPTIQLMAN